MPPSAILVPVGDFPEELLEELSRRTQIPLGPARVDPGPAWNPARGQYDSTRLLLELKARYQGIVIGATACDLFIPVLTFVFGEAEMPGRAAIFSIHRLREEFYGLPQNRELLIARAVRELLHEYGHLSGLAHCQDSACIMSPAHSVERVDSKDVTYCPACRERLKPAPAPEPVPQDSR
ncbi:MAG: archaemetzincin [Acidobacteria bacterium]|nr:archaemetzincin [Acidobacteriota bacterium]